MFNGSHFAIKGFSLRLVSSHWLLFTVQLSDGTRRYYRQVATLETTRTHITTQSATVASKADDWRRDASRFNRQTIVTFSYFVLGCGCNILLRCCVDEMKQRIVVDAYQWVNNTCGCYLLSGGYIFDTVLVYAPVHTGKDKSGGWQSCDVPIDMLTTILFAQKPMGTVQSKCCELILVTS
jgi:hypothetical protein